MKNISMKKYILVSSTLVLLSLTAHVSVTQAQQDNTDSQGSDVIVPATPAQGGNVILPANPAQGSDVNNPATPAQGSDVNIPATPAQGSDVSRSGGTFFLQNPLQVDSIGELVVLALEVFTYLVVIVGVLMLIYVGLRFVLAMGNMEEIKKRKDQLLWIVIGLALVIGARIIVAVVINTLQATGTVSPGVINSANDALRGN